jgi:hypothetical protein
MKHIRSIQTTPKRCFILLVLLRCSASFTLRPLSQLSVHRLVNHTKIQPGQSQGRQLEQLGRTRLQQAMSSINNGPVSLKSAAVPLLDAGKAFARAGELMIDMTTAMDLYGGALSSAGANIRNAGDNIAQAAASCRFKTAHELVIDEIREASSALLECSSKLQQAVDEANTDKNSALATSIGTLQRKFLQWGGGVVLDQRYCNSYHRVVFPKKNWIIFPNCFDRTNDTTYERL